MYRVIRQLGCASVALVVKRIASWVIGGEEGSRDASCSVCRQAKNKV